MNILDSFSVIALKVLKFATVSLASTMVVTSSYVAWDMHHTEKAAFSSYDLSEYRPQVESGEPASLEEVEAINKDSRAWLTVYGTHIDYPVTQGRDDLEYVNKDIYGKTTPTGSIYLATQNSSDFSDPYNLIYGHHMDNGAMFGDVDNFLEGGYFGSHTKGVLITDDRVWDLTLMGSLETFAYDAVVYSPKRTGLGIVDYVRSNGTQWRDPGNVTKVLALSTCDYGRTNGRDLVFFRMSPHDGPYEEYIPDEKPPLTPGGHGDNYWSLMDLLCMIATLYCFLPIHLILAKFRRNSLMMARNDLLNEPEEEPSGFKEKVAAWAKRNGLDDPLGKKDVKADSLYDTRKTGRVFTAGTVAEAALALASVLIFVITQDMSLPVRIIDKWTPLMLVLLFACWFADVKLLRTRLWEDKEESGN